MFRARTAVNIGQIRSFFLRSWRPRNEQSSSRRRRNVVLVWSYLMVFSLGEILDAISQTVCLPVRVTHWRCVSSIGSAESIPGCRFLGQLAGELRDNLPVNRVVRVASASGRLLDDYVALWCTVSPERPCHFARPRCILWTSKRARGRPSIMPACTMDTYLGLPPVLLTVWQPGMCYRVKVT